jgi:hypothetical protein
MTRLATMGTSSCATIAIQGFKKSDENLERKYQETGSFERPGKDTSWFYNNVLYPTEQELGRTEDYPFSALMEALNCGNMHNKFIIATINSYQYHNGFWKDLLEKHEFSLIDKTNNDIGEICYIFARNYNRVDITEDEK